MKLLKAMKEVANNPDPVINKTEEEKNGSKNSTASADQNVVVNILKKSRSGSNNTRSNNTQSNNRSSDRVDNLSSLSDLK